MDRLPHYCPICAYLEWNLDGLVEMCWDYLDMVRARVGRVAMPVMLHVCRQAHTVTVGWQRMLRSASYLRGGP